MTLSIIASLAARVKGLREENAELRRHILVLRIAVLLLLIVSASQTIINL